MLRSGLPVNEVFTTLQGEATFAGTPSTFVRFQGCPVGCAWCDTKHTWPLHPTDEVDVVAIMQKDHQASPKWSELSVDELLDVIHDLKLRHVVLTGGEPALYNLTDLTARLDQLGHRTQIETSGTHALRVDATTWVTVSPKINMPGGFAVRDDAMLRADEVKHPVAVERNVDELLALLETSPPRHGVPVWLQPIFQAPRARDICIDACLRHGFRLSVQTHKMLNLR